jgi:hypothetical protein
MKRILVAGSYASKILKTEAENHCRPDGYLAMAGIRGKL